MVERVEDDVESNAYWLRRGRERRGCWRTLLVEFKCYMGILTSSVVGYSWERQEPKEAL